MKGKCEVQCKNCGKPFLKSVFDITRTKSHFCSRECFNVFRNIETQRKFPNRICPMCKTVFQDRHGTRVYCSRNCRKQDKNIELTCKKCGKRFIRLKCQISNSIPFCSRECSDSSRYLTTRCKICNSVITYRCCISAPKYCSKKCEGASKTLRKDIPCYLCGTIASKTPSQIKHAKHNFCSRRCAAEYSKQFIIKRKVSKAEILLRQYISTDFPNEVIFPNTREVLKCGYEIDIWIPRKELAIEINGPCHYFNIYGSNTLVNIQLRDQTKIAEILQRGFKLITMDISLANSTSKVRRIITEQYQNTIKPILLN